MKQNAVNMTLGVALSAVCVSAAPSTPSPRASRWGRPTNSFWTGDMSVDQQRGPLTGRVAGDFSSTSFSFFRAQPEMDLLRLAPLEKNTCQETK